MSEKQKLTAIYLPKDPETGLVTDYMGGYTSIDDYLKKNTPTKKSSEDTESVSNSGDSFESLDGATNDIYVHPESMKTVLQGIDELIIDVNMIERKLNSGDVEVEDINSLLTRWCVIFGYDDTDGQPGGLMGKINTIPEIQKLPKFQEAVEVQKRVSKYIEELKIDYRLQVSATEMAVKVRDEYRLGYKLNELQNSMTDVASDVNDVLKQKSRQQEK